MLDFIKKTAQKLGAKNCEKCNQLDFSFGLNPKVAKCGFCSNDIPSYSQKDSLRFSLEILKEFIISYDDFNKVADKMIFLHYIDGLLTSLIYYNSLPSVEDFKQFQSFFCVSGRHVLIGSITKLGGAIRVNSGVLTIATDKNNRVKDGLYSLAVLFLALKYIIDFKYI